jgi:hypothetical protein
MATMAAIAVENLINYYAREGWEYVRSEEFRADFFKSRWASFFDDSNPLLQMFIFRRDAGIRANVTEEDASIELTFSKYLDNDAYQIYLVKKYSIEMNNVLNKFICVNKSFQNIESALSYAHEIESANDIQISKFQEEQIEAIKNDVGKKAECPSCGGLITTKTEACNHCNAWLGTGSNMKPIPVSE